MPFGFKLSHRLSLTKAAAGTFAGPRRVVASPASSASAEQNP